ncbi:MAG: monovalent cation:proton antiporter-2 (CPA2) family protein [Chitinophagales bacterium]|nr:monovalent cation:proton antiporter-2 (CPA2) family protein [Chitinophagales bacterium]MDW8274436.1 monovalent cation:proton antiporter-2 (CPA2) family protein [Chitinophagales bacterium]
MNGSFLLEAIIYLSAGVVFVSLAKKLGLSSVLGYVIGGMMIGPYVLGWIGTEGEDIMHFAEFGVVMMLFLIGLEIEPEQFWKMRKSIVGLGGMQYSLTTLLFMLPGIFIMGWSWQMSLAVSLALSMSSTAIVLQTLKEKGLSQTTAGQASFSVLLFQDIMVIPILALLPLLVSQGEIHLEREHPQAIIKDLPGWLQTLLVLGAVGLVFISGRFLVVPGLRIISKTRIRELFTASALLLVVAVAYLMEMVGLSPALGAFLAGVVLATSEFRHELESDLQPFKGLLLGLFFIGVGASINFRLIGREPLTIAGVVAAIVFVKACVLFAAGRLFRLKSDQNLSFTFNLSQVGEFAFVILAFSLQLNLVERTWNDILMAATAITMTLTPVWIAINEKYIDPYFGTKETVESYTPDTIHEKHPVIIAGFGHFGSTIGRFLRANGVEATILDFDSDRVDLLRKMGFKVYYGDATRLDLLEAAGAAHAKILIAAIDSPDANAILIHNARKHFPHLHIMARARNRFDAYDFLDEGVTHIYRETLYTSVHLAADALRHLGFRAYTVKRMAQNFIKYDEEALMKLKSERNNMQQYIFSAKKQIEMQEKLLHEDLLQHLTSSDHCWDSGFVREKTKQL